MVEVVIASAIILVAVVALLGVHSLYLKSALSNSNTVKGAYLAEEGIEAVRYLRDDSWSAKIATLTNGTAYGLALTGSGWVASTTATQIGEIARTFTLSSVSRDATSRDIVSSGGVVDPNTRLLTVRVSWESNGTTTTKSLSTYLTNIWQN